MSKDKTMIIGTNMSIANRIKKAELKRTAAAKKLMREKLAKYEQQKEEAKLKAREKLKILLKEYGIIDAVFEEKHRELLKTAFPEHYQ